MIDRYRMFEPLSLLLSAYPMHSIIGVLFNYVIVSWCHGSLSCLLLRQSVVKHLISRGVRILWSEHAIDNACTVIHIKINVQIILVCTKQTWNVSKHTIRCKEHTENKLLHVLPLLRHNEGKMMKRGGILRVISVLNRRLNIDSCIDSVQRNHSLATILN